MYVCIVWVVTVQGSTPDFVRPSSVGVEVEVEVEPGPDQSLNPVQYSAYLQIR
jgi:hypothetical protein